MKLEFMEIEKNPELLPDSVYAYILNHHLPVQVAEIDPAYADGASLHAKYDVPLEMELNCLVVEGHRNEDIRYAAIVVPYGKKANMNAKVRNPLDVKKISFADLAYVTEKTGMEYGSITPIGLPKEWKILIDASVFAQEYVVVGSGKANGKLLLPSALFRNIPNCIAVEGLARD